MLRFRNFALVAALLVPLPAAAVTVTTPQGTAEVFARGDLVDVVGLLRLAGAEVEFAAAAGSYSAALGGHLVQFTPGGSLAVVDGRLAPLPGPVRTLEEHVVASLTTAGALLGPLGWAVGGNSTAPQLFPVSGGVRLTVEVVRTPTGNLIVVRGVSQPPRLLNAPGAVTLQFPTPVELGSAVAPTAELLGAEAQGNSLTLRLAPNTQVASTYSLADPARFVLHLAASQPVTGMAQARQGPLVVLDPGHGGEDEGARGPGGEREKDITLAVARLTAARLQAAGVNARLTRDGDDTLPLAQRTALANRLRADAFVSIHVNASPAKGARGAETYFMNADASDAQAAQAAARENAGAGSDAVQLILWDLAHVANLNASSKLALDIQDRLNALHGITDRGVKQAPFVVLTGAAMPAVLVEVGFLSNPDEAGLLMSAPYESDIAGALSDAIVTFLHTPQATGTPAPAPTP
jgi:N-acetylmuramoyl-L-alanine amidase